MKWIKRLTAILVIGGFVWAMCSIPSYPVQADPSPMFKVLSETDVSNVETYYVVEDTKTDCQYIATEGTHGVSGITPRLDNVGRIICGK